MEYVAKYNIGKNQKIVKMQVQPFKNFLTEQDVDRKKKPITLRLLLLLVRIKKMMIVQ